jgi:hypothetical protein
VIEECVVKVEENGRGVGRRLHSLWLKRGEMNDPLEEGCEDEEYISSNYVIALEVEKGPR